MFFQSSHWSGTHAIWQSSPSAKTSPELGVVGVGSAKAIKARDKMRVGSAPRECIEKDLWGAGKKKKEANVESKRATGGKEREGGEGTERGDEIRP